MKGARLIAIGAAAVCLLTAVYLARSDREADRLRQADRERREQRYASAAADAGKVTRPPFDAHAAVVRGQALERLGRLREASDAYALAVRLEPNDWSAHRRWAVVLLRLGKREQAAREMGRALALNPRMKLPPPFVRAKRRSGARTP